MIALIIAVVSFGAGAYASARWAPRLRATRVGTVAAVVVAVLVGAALAVVAMDVYVMIRTLDRSVGEFSSSKNDIVAQTIREALVSAGTLLGLAAAVHLLAPPPETSD